MSQFLCWFAKANYTVVHGGLKISCLGSKVQDFRGSWDPLGDYTGSCCDSGHTPFISLNLEVSVSDFKMHSELVQEMYQIKSWQTYSI